MTLCYGCICNEGNVLAAPIVASVCSKILGYLLISTIFCQASHNLLSTSVKCVCVCVCVVSYFLFVLMSPCHVVAYLMSVVFVVCQCKTTNELPNDDFKCCFDFVGLKFSISVRHCF